MATVRLVARPQSSYKSNVGPEAGAEAGNFARGSFRTGSPGGSNVAGLQEYRRAFSRQRSDTLVVNARALLEVWGLSNPRQSLIRHWGTMAEVCQDRFLPRKPHGTPGICTLIWLLLYQYPHPVTNSLPCAGALEEAWPLHTALQTWLDALPAPEVAMRLSWNGSCAYLENSHVSQDGLVECPCVDSRYFTTRPPLLPGTRLQALRLQQQLAASPGLCSQDPGPSPFLGAHSALPP